MDRKDGFNKITQAHYDARRSQSSWRNIKIHFDLTGSESVLNNNNMSSRVQFYRKVYDCTGEWWSQALQINDSRSRMVDQLNARGKSNYYKGFRSGQDYTDYDLLIQTKFENNNGNALAWAGPVDRHPDTQRPITGTCTTCPFGDSNFKTAKDSVNRATGTMIHEFGHVIAFISFQNYHERYLGYSNTIKLVLWTGPAVKEKGKTYYNCSSSQWSGLPMQTNNYTNGTHAPGGHWSETFLGDEIMTPTTGHDPERVSPMSLALCEDSGWYKPDYSFSERYVYNKGKGCAWTTSCPSPAKCTAGSSGFVVSNYKGIGYCGSDANGCAKESTYSNRDCMQGDNWEKDYANKYGAIFGGNCVVVKGKFVASSGYYQATTVGQAQCNSSGSSYTLEFNSSLNNSSGNIKVTCSSAGTKSFNGNSNVVCQDPTKLCNQRFGDAGAGKCHESCLLNGRCQVGHGRRRQLTTQVVHPYAQLKQAFRKMQSSKPPCPAGYEYPEGDDEKPDNGGDEQPGDNGGNGEDNKADDDNNGNFKCWCYSNTRSTTGSCSDLSEDND